MLEVASRGEDHRDAVFVARFDHRVVAPGSIRLSDRGDAGCRGLVDAVAEGEEGIGCDD